MSITLGNTIFGALDGGREVDWRLVFRDLAQRLAKGVGKLKPTPICPFLFHLYDSQGLLTEDEELDYLTAKEMAGYRITPDSDSRPRSDNEGQAPIPAASPIQEVLVRMLNWSSVHKLNRSSSHLHNPKPTGTRATGARGGTGMGV